MPCNAECDFTIIVVVNSACSIKRTWLSASIEKCRNRRGAWLFHGANLEHTSKKGVLD